MPLATTTDPITTSSPQPRVLDRAPTREEFWRDIYPQQVPTLWRQAQAEHPLVALGRQGPEAFLRELVARAGQRMLTVTSAPPRVAGRMGFGEQRWVDWGSRDASLADFAQDVLTELRAPSGHCDYVQSATVRQCLPELVPLTELWLVDPAQMLDERTQLWIGSGGQRVPVHRDESHSIAMMVSGAKEFLLFPPEQLPNLYTTPRRELAGDPMRSAIDPRAPDLERYPRLAQALPTMTVLRIEPGDVLFLPAHWWHAVDSFGFNVMCNSRWFDMSAAMRGDLSACFAHAMVTARTVGPAQARRFRERLQRELFDDDGAAARTPAMQAALHEQLRVAVATTRRERVAPLPRMDAPLRINPRASVTLAGDAVELRVGPVRHFLDWAYLPLLRAFTRPCSPQAALEQLSRDYDFEPDRAIARVRAMLEDGVLLGEPGPRPPEPELSQRARVDAATAHVALQLAEMPRHHLQAFAASLETFAFLSHGEPYPHLPPGQQGLLGVPMAPEAAATFFERARRNLGERLASALVAEDFWQRWYRLAPTADFEVASPGLAREDVAAGTRHQLAWDQLEVLACFRQPRTPTAALAELGQSVQLGADDLRQLLIGMIAAGVLVPTSEPDPVDG
ncbi:MAG: cupin-like domain-containing protein [Nannocystaceae bacterium]|nr:cupin-like domain-containing protein [Nannocystaceae bacterium]